MTQPRLPDAGSDAGGTALAEALRGAVDRLPPPLLPGDLWPRARRERRRRLLRRTGAVAAAALVAVLVGAPLLGVVAFPTLEPAGDRVRGYPMRIGHQWIVRDLPARPGPLAALVESGVRDGVYDWLAVSPSGHQWRLSTAGFAQNFPALSADGRYLGYLEPDGVGYRIVDLVTGDRTVFPGVADGATGPGVNRSARELGVFGQSPAYFSPDGRRVAANGFPADVNPYQGGSGIAILDRTTGLASYVPPTGSTSGILAGWSGPESLWLVSPIEPGTINEPVEMGSATVTDVGLDGRVRTSFTITAHPPHEGPWNPIQFDQWSGPVSPAGASLPVRVTDPWGDGVYRFDRDGAQQSWAVPGLTPTCGLSWVGDDLIVPEQIGEPQHPVSATVRLRVGSSPRTLAVVSPRIGRGCVIWAADALAAGPTGPHPFGTSTATWTWYWQEILAAVLVFVALVAAGLLLGGAKGRARRRP